MTQNRDIVLYHWPQSRSVSIHYLLEELKADYQLKIVDIRHNAQKNEAFLAINPMGKLPTITHNGVPVTESTAILTYLSDLYADRGLTPGIHDTLRGPYLRWIAFYAACFEPALADRALKREPGRASMMPYGDFETVWNTITTQLTKGPYILGDRFHTLDILWGAGLAFMTRFGVAPSHDAVSAYIKRIEERPAFASVNAQSEVIMKNAGQ